MRTTGTTVVRIAAAGLAALFFAGSIANAATTIKASELDRKGGNATGFVPPLTSSDPEVTGSGGLFKFTQDPSTPTPDLLPSGSEFLAFCLEFNEELEKDLITYDLVALSAAPIDAGGSLPTGMGATKANQIATIIGNVFGLAGPPSYASVSAATALAVQMAIWEIVHETTTVAANYDTTSGDADWSAAGTAGLTDGNALLTKLANLVASGWKSYTAAQVGLAALVAQPTSDNKQDFLVWERDPRQDVPLPAAAWLLLSGLAGLGVVSRRRKTQA